MVKSNCPFCGAPPERISLEIEYVTPFNDPYKAMACQACGAQGPTCGDDDKEADVEATWDNRDRRYAGIK